MKSEKFIAWKNRKKYFKPKKNLTLPLRFFLTEVMFNVFGKPMLKKNTIAAILSKGTLRLSKIEAAAVVVSSATVVVSTGASAG